ncbi:1-phosphofructokinase [Paenibacillus sp. F411]|uniref:1-phosphofructokinase n=1 Tax=Paenibacillus sp. F411 TaxID=2820239 RepID=UPI001AAFC31E|nr:1-phosphofructokinase [Paenibacillus sp. F411]MBO2945004.1 1-phosphofructokinase [Paenibacillus sp. F411]
MIYTITLNPSIDYVVELEELALGGLNRMKRDMKYAGGKGINVSRILNELEADNVAMGFVGGFTGQFIEERLKEHRMESNFIHIRKDTRINIKLKHGAETEINSQGPVIEPAEAEELLTRLAASLRQGDIVVLSGSVPPSLGEGYYNRCIQICKEQGAEFVIDTTGAALLEALPSRPLVIKPNHHELAELFQTEIRTRDELISYGRRLLGLGAQHVLISMAGEGALLLREEQVYHASVPPGQVKNSVGAGDSMIGGFVGTYARTGNAVEAFKMGTACGSATAFADDLADQEHIQQLYAKVQLQEL